MLPLGYLASQKGCFSANALMNPEYFVTPCDSKDLLEALNVEGFPYSVKEQYSIKAPQLYWELDMQSALKDGNYSLNLRFQCIKKTAIKRQLAKATAAWDYSAGFHH